MKNLIHTLLAVVMLVAVLALCDATRGAPTKHQVSEQVSAIQAPAPIVVASVPPQTVGFDVICNITNVERIGAVTLQELRLSPTGAWRLPNATLPESMQLPAPTIVLLA